MEPIAATAAQLFQPFLRFWWEEAEVGSAVRRGAVSTLLEILVWIYGHKWPLEPHREFQPFLRFWLRRDHEGPHPYDGGVGVSTLLEILERRGQGEADPRRDHSVSTLLEILDWH